MPTINLEMMKQLLREFSEKEALTTEEIGVIDKEVISLEQRIEDCRTKLKNLSEDKVRLASIQQRYSGGKFISPPALAIKDSANEQIPKPTPRPKPAPSVSLSSVLDDSKAVLEKEVPAPKSDDPPTSDHPKEPELEPGGVKGRSINDTLKGLFRK